MGEREGGARVKPAREGGARVKPASVIKNIVSWYNHCINTIAIHVKLRETCKGWNYCFFHLSMYVTQFGSI